MQSPCCRNQPNDGVNVNTAPRLLLIAIVVSGCASKEILRDPTDCWQHDLGEKYFHNVITVCVANDRAAESVYFPNAKTSWPSTICRHAGKLTLLPDENMNMDFESGSCENRRTTPESKMTCKKNSDRSLSCKLSSRTLTGVYEFSPLAPGTKLP